MASAIKIINGAVLNRLPGNDVSDRFYLLNGVLDDMIAFELPTSGAAQEVTGDITEIEMEVLDATVSLGLEVTGTICDIELEVLDATVEMQSMVDFAAFAMQNRIRFWPRRKLRR